MLQAYRFHGVEPEVWPMSTSATPHVTFQRILDMSVVCGGLGHGLILTGTIPASPVL